MQKDFYEIRKTSYEKEETVYICNLDGKEFSSLRKATKHLLRNHSPTDRIARIEGQDFYFCETDLERSEIAEALGWGKDRSTWEGSGWYDDLGSHISHSIEECEKEFKSYQQSLEKLKEAKNGKI